MVQDPADRGFWKRPPVRRYVGVPRRACGPFAAATAAAVGAILATTALGGHGPASRAASIPVRGAGPTGIAAAYGNPTRCLSVTVSSIDPTFARADFNHAGPCGRYAGYPTIFHVVDGSRRPVLVVVSYSCPATGIPRAVQNELGVCPRTRPHLGRVARTFLGSHGRHA